MLAYINPDRLDGEEEVVSKTKVKGNLEKANYNQVGKDGSCLTGLGLKMVGTDGFIVVKCNQNFVFIQGWIQLTKGSSQLGL